MVALLIYLTVALRNAYEIKSWLLSLLYAVVVNVIYFVTTFFAVMVISFVSIIVALL